MTDRQYDEAIERICSGNKDGLKLIYEEYMPYIYRQILGVLQNREDAEDVTSAFFTRIWNTAEQYKKGSGHKAYLSAIARNMCIDFIRKRNREIPTDLSEEKTEEDYTEDFSEQVVEDLTIQQALKKLEPEERETVFLKISGGFKFREISKIQKKPLGTVTWCYQNAIKKLRRYGYE